MCVYDTEDINSERNTLCILFPSSEILVAEVVILFCKIYNAYLEILLHPEITTVTSYHMYLFSL